MAIGRHRPSLEHFLNYLRIIFQLKLMSNMPNLGFLSYKYKFQADKATNELTKKNASVFLVVGIFRSNCTATCYPCFMYVHQLVIEKSVFKKN